MGKDAMLSPDYDFDSRFAGEPFESVYHQRIVRDFLLKNPGRRMVGVRQFFSWTDVPDMPKLSEDSLVFVDGGIRYEPLDVGRASLVNDGGIVRASIHCGLFYKNGGIVEAPIYQRDGGIGSVVEKIRSLFSAKKTEEHYQPLKIRNKLLLGR